MVEIQNKYKIGVRRFGIFNWIGAWTLYKKEVLRFLIVSGQTLLGPILTSILFLTVISLAIGDSRSDVLGVSYIEFLASGLIMMQVIQQSFSHSSSSLMINKMQGTIVDVVSSPLSAFEVTISIVLASVTRGTCIAIISSIIFIIFLDIQIQNILFWILYVILSSFLLGSAGFIAGIYADKFDQMATITNFLIVPLSFLSGTFYSINKLPNFLKKISFFNPFFHMIDGFRFSFIGNLDGSIKFGSLYLLAFSILTWFFAFYLYNKGYKIKT